MPPAWSFAVMAYNEAATIDRVLDLLLETLPALKGSFEILVVDDGSTDSTAQQVGSRAASEPRIRLLQHPRNLGIGRTLKDAYQQTQGQWTAVLPADLQFDPRDLVHLAPYLEDADVINIFRATRHDPASRRLLSAAERLVTRALFGLRVRDLHWVKLYRRWVLDKIELETDSPLVDTELLVKAARLGARIREVALPHYPRTAGVSHGASLNHLAASARDLVRLKRALGSTRR